MSDVQELRRLADTFDKLSNDPAERDTPKARVQKIKEKSFKGQAGMIVERLLHGGLDLDGCRELLTWFDDAQGTAFGEHSTLWSRFIWGSLAP